MVHHGRTTTPPAITLLRRRSVRRPRPDRQQQQQKHHQQHLPVIHLLLLCISTLCILPTTISAISGGEELSSFEEDNSHAHLQTLSAATSEQQQQQLFTIADQQAYVGKLFYYHIATPAGLRNLSLVQAGHHLNLNGGNDGHHRGHHHGQSPSSSSSPPLLPEWLHFNADTGELFGSPLEKKIYFIQVTAILDGDEDQASHEQQQQHQHGKTYEDIFVIEVLDAPAYLSTANGQHLQSSSSDHLQLYQCRIELKAPFTSIATLYETIVRLHGSPLVSSSSEQHPRDAKSNSLQLMQWLNRFNVESAISSSGWKASYDVEQCGTSVQHHQRQQQQQQSTRDHIYLDQNSEQLLSRLSEHRIESELVKISSGSGSGSSGHQAQFDLDSSSSGGSGNGFGFNSMLRSSEAEGVSSGELPSKEHQQQPRRNSHRRRNAYADDPDAYSTPTLKGDWRSLTTSTIDLAASDLQVLSRTAIPSMVSPTFTGVPGSEVTPTPVFGSGGGEAAVGAPVGGRPPMYPHLYSTPVLMPVAPSLSIRTYDEAAASILVTPVIPQMVASTSVLLEVMGVPTQAVPSLAVPEPESNLTTTASTTTSTTSSTTPSSTTEHAGKSPSSTLKPNHRPFVNRRIAKLSITAGKYWQYSIPESTFMDVEDGNTKALRLAFFKDSELPPIDYWIQFDHENQYLYALPTEENIGRYRFSLLAMDTAGAEVSETLEIYVRQPRESLTYTHRFILANVSWDANNLFVERIQAVSSLLQRMATQIFEEASSQQDPAEAVQKQTILHSISVLSITKNNGGSGGNGGAHGGGHGHGHHGGHHDGNHFTAPSSSAASQQQYWTITWSNDSLRRTPCPEDEVNALFSKLYDITYPSDANGFMQPSSDLKNALSPEFSIAKVKREFIGRSACGSFASLGTGDGTFRQKEKIVFSNRLNRLGPYKVGVPFRFVIPKDTVYSAGRQGSDSTELDLSLAPVEPANYIPEWIFFDVREQTIYGLPYRQEHVQTLELKLIAEDRQTGGREADIFAVDVILDKDTREDYLLEVTMSFAMRNVEKLDAGNLKLTAKDYYQLSHLIATRLMGNSNLEAFRMLEINRYRFTKMDDLIIDTFTNNDHSLGAPLDPLDSPKFEDPKADQQLGGKSRRSAAAVIDPDHHHHHQHLSKQLKKRRRSYHHLRFKRGLFQTGAHGPDYFYEFIWTNRSLVTSYLHSANAFGGGTLYETDNCPKEDIKRDLYDRLFPRSATDFATSVSLAQNASHLDVMEIYSRLFESIEANVEFLSVEWTPKSVCQYTPGLDARTFGAKPIKEFESDYPPPPGASPQTPPQPPPTAEPPGGPGHPDDDLDHFPTDYSSTYLGDKLLTMIIPPIAILTALLFAVTIGCCFHRANLRRKAMGNMTEITEENPNLYRQRIPIQFEFERGGGPGSIRGMGLGEQEAMLDGSKMGRHPIQIMPMKRGIGGGGGPGGHPPPLPGHGGRGGPKGMMPGQQQQYMMLPQQHQ